MSTYGTNYGISELRIAKALQDAIDYYGSIGTMPGLGTEYGESEKRIAIAIFENTTIGGGNTAVWGNITGNLASQSDLSTALSLKQNSLVSGTNIKTINTNNLLGSGDITINANPAGSTGQIQFNDSGSFGASSNLTWDVANNRLGINNANPLAQLDVVNSSASQVGLSVKAASGQSVNIVEINNNTGTNLFKVDKSGYTAVSTAGVDMYISNPGIRVISSGGLGAGIGVDASANGGRLWSFFSAASGSASVGAGGFGLYSSTSGYAFGVSSVNNVGFGTLNTLPTATCDVFTTAAATVGFRIRGFSSQSANLGEVKLSDGTIKSWWTNTGNFVVKGKASTAETLFAVQRASSAVNFFEVVNTASDAATTMITDGGSNSLSVGGASGIALNINSDSAINIHTNTAKGLGNLFIGSKTTTFSANSGGSPIADFMLATTQTVDFIRIRNQANTATISVLAKADGSYQPASLTDSLATNNSLYYSTTQSKLAFKNASGTVEVLGGYGAGGIGLSAIRLQATNGYGSSATTVRRWLNTVHTVGSDITYTDSAVNGGTFTINTAGIYGISYTENLGNTDSIGITLNSSTLNGTPSATEYIACTSQQGGSWAESVAWTGYLPAGSVIRAQTNSGYGSGNPASCYFSIARLV